MLNIMNIEDALKSLAISGRYRFNAYQVAYLSHNPDVKEVYDYLVTREPYVVIREYEILCPNSDATATYSSIDDILSEWTECRICGKEFLIDENEIQIVFNFSESYLKQVNEDLEEKKEKRPLELVV